MRVSGVDAVVVLQEHCLQYVSVRVLLSGVDAVVVLCYRSTVCSMLV